MSDVSRVLPSIDKIEYAIVGSGGVVRENTETSIFPETHRFTPGLYIREIFMPAGSFLTSRTHITEHPYVVSLGIVSVHIENEQPALIIAPYTGITKPGTRRLLYVHEDTVWTTFHVTNLTDVKEIEKVLYAPWDNPYLAAIGTGGEK